MTSLKRIESLPDVPTLNESGLKGFELSGVLAGVLGQDLHALGQPQQFRPQGPHLVSLCDRFIAEDGERP